MLKKILSIKKENYHRIFTFLGIKIKFSDLKNFCKSLEANANIEKIKNKWATRGKIFLWSNIEKMTTEQKIWYVSQEFYERTEYFPNFKQPKSFNEKINWLKFNYFNPIEKIVIDKYEFKNYIKEQLGEGYTIPLIGDVYSDVNDIDFDNLPERFVIKTTTNGAAQGVTIVKDKKKLDIDYIKYKFNNLLQDWNSVYYSILASGYKDIKPRIIIEEYMPIREGKAIEYKMFCFHGEMKFCLVECDYFGTKPKRAYYDKDFNAMPFSISTLPTTVIERKPEQYDEMVRISEKLSKDIPFVRVDFYIIDGRIYVGELTFTSGGGYSLFKPREWDYKIGEWLDLSKLNPNYLHIEPEFAENAKKFINPDIVDSHMVEKDSILC